MSGVCIAGLMTTVLPAARAGATFQANISSGKFQGMTCATTPQAWKLGNSDSRRCCAHACVVIEVTRDQGNVNVAALADGLTGVQGFKKAETARVLLDLTGERIEIARPLVAGERLPRGQSFARRGDGRS